MKANPQRWVQVSGSATALARAPGNLQGGKALLEGCLQNRSRESRLQRGLAGRLEGRLGKL